MTLDVEPGDACKAAAYLCSWMVGSCLQMNTAVSAVLHGLQNLPLHECMCYEKDGTVS